MNRVGSAIVYTLLRLAFFIIPFGLMLLLPIFQDLWWLAAVFAAVIGLSLSVIFLSKPLGRVTEGAAERASARRRPSQSDLDAAAEDEPDGDEDAADAGQGSVASEGRDDPSSAPDDDSSDAADGGTRNH